MKKIFWKNILIILKCSIFLIHRASLKLIHLKISVGLVFSSTLYHNSSLIPLFYRLQSLYLQSKYGRFHKKYASKLVEHCPSLIHLELDVYSIDVLKSFLIILLKGLSQLVHLRIHFYKNELLTNKTGLTENILGLCRKARSSTPDNTTIRVNTKTMNIYFNGCSICMNPHNSF